MSQILDESVEKLAKLAIAWERAHGVYFPASALEMAQLGSQILQWRGIRYWVSRVSPQADSITCTKCRNTSHNPNDVANRYCGFCHEFMEADSAPLILREPDVL